MRERLEAERFHDLHVQLRRRQLRVARRLEVVRTHADRHRPPLDQVRAEAGLVDRRGVPAPFGDPFAPAPRDLPLDEVHLRRAEERGDELRPRVLVDLERGALLLHEAAVQDPERVGERHRLDLIVRDVERGRAQAIVQPADVDPHLGAERGVEVRERLVEEEDRGTPHDRAPHRDALALPPGELLREALEEGVEAEHRARFADALVDLARRAPAQLEAEGEVVADGEVRVERVALEDHRHVARARRLARDVTTGELDRSRVRLLEPRHEPEERALAAAARADEDGERPLRNVEVDAPQDRVRAERLGHAARGTPDRSRAHARRCRDGRGFGRGGARRETTRAAAGRPSWRERRSSCAGFGEWA